MTSVLPGIGSRKKKGSLQSSSIKLPQATHKHRQSRIAASTVHPTNRVVVAVNAAKLTRHALEWALNNVVQPGDHITLLALWPSGRKLWNLPFFSGDCARSWKKGTKPHELQQEINDSCCSMMDELHALCDSKKARVSVKVVPDGRPGAIAVEVQQAGASWVVLDKQVMKREGKLCMEQLRCNLVLVKQNNSKILRLNLKGSPPHEAGYVYSDSNLQFGDEYDDHTARHQAPRKRTSKSKCKGTHHASSDADSLASSPDVGTPFTASETGTSSPRSLATSPPTSGEPPVLLHSSLITCADSTIPGDAAVWDADYISDIEADSVSDYGAVDFLSAITADRSGPLCTPASGSPDESGAEGIFDKSFRMMPEAWVEPEFLEGSMFREAWKPAPMSSMSSRSPTSADATPKSENMSYTRSSAKQGRVSSASPSPSNRVVGSGASVSSRAVLEGGARVRAHSTSPQSRTGRSAISSKLPPSCRQRDLLKSWRPPSDTDSKPTSGAASSRSVVTTRELLEKFLEWDQSKRSSDKLRDYDQLGDGDFERTSSVRRAMSLAKHHVPAGPPPLCSICQHKSPVFGKPPRRFSYADLELATGGFPKANFLAEGGFGSVHRGVLPDGQAVAVKQHKHPSSQGDIEFCSEVEVLSCAQHRNVVMLIGYCIEDNERLLVYEFICNGSLDSHLYGSEKDVLTWAARQKIAVGAARGLRYLHEECRVGCIIHRDMRPNNILLTHDFEPMVGDFGLARWQPDGDLGVQTRVIGTFGYLAPEYAQSGQITEKADVYSFGVVLLELATGRKAVELTRPKGQQCLTEWARPLLEQGLLHDLTDPRLEGQYVEYELHCLLHAASLCISKDPQLRPRMSQVLRILEGDIVIDGTMSSSPPPYNATKLAPFDNRFYSGSRSSRISAEYNVRGARAGSVSPPLVSYSGSLLLTSSGSQGGSSSRNLLSTSDPPAAATKLSYEALRAAYLPDANPNCSPRRLSFEEL